MSTGAEPGPFRKVLRESFKALQGDRRLADARERLEKVIAQANADVEHLTKSGVVLRLLAREEEAHWWCADLIAARPVALDPAYAGVVTHYRTAVSFCVLADGSIMVREQMLPDGGRYHWQSVPDLEKLFAERLFDRESSVTRALVRAARLPQDEK